MKTEILKIIQSPCCNSDLIVTEQTCDEVEIIKGTLECVNCHQEYQIENGMSFLYKDDSNWISKAMEAKGWVDLHRDKGIYDQTGVDIDFVLPYFKDEPWIKVAKEFDICLDMLQLKGHEKILDLGAGRGWAAKNFALKGCYSVAIDIIPDNQIGLGRLKEIMKASNTFCERIIGDNENLPFKDGSFDFVFCAATLHHTTNLQSVLKNVYRVLSNTGKLVAMNEPCIGLFESEHATLNNCEELKYGINETRPNLIQYYNALWGAGFRKIDISPYQTYEQTNSDVEIWSKALGITETDINNYLVKIFNSVPQKLNKRIQSSRRDALKNAIMAQLSSEIILIAEKLKKIKIGFVVQRYGEEVNGGAELLCRRIAEHLSKYYRIEVITTCAKDYITWRNEYSPGKDMVNGIMVWRFPVDNSRDIHKFNRFSEKIFGSERRIAEDELKWMKLQGPYSTELLDFIKNNKDDYDYFVFFTYLYCTTFFGLPLVKEKAILVPTAHDEPPIYLSIFDTLFKLPIAIIYSTEEEKKFVCSKFKNENILSEIIGVGIDIPEKINADSFKQKYKVDNYIIYAGRIDESKGCKELFEYFLQYKNEVQTDVKLVLLGKAVMEIPEHPDIISLGFVSEQDKFNGIKAAELLIMPSKYESLSMVIMEAWLCNNAVLVNGNCEVLKGHCLRSNGGLYYKNYEEFRECLNLLVRDSQLREFMGENGRRYVEDNYAWETIEGRYLRLLTKIANRMSENLTYQV